MAYIANVLQNGLEVSEKTSKFLELGVMIILVVSFIIFSEFFMAVSIYVALLAPFLLLLSYFIDTLIADIRFLAKAKKV